MMFKDWKELNIGGYQLKKLVRASDGLILFNKESKPVIYYGCCFWLYGVPAGGVVKRGTYAMVTGSTVGTYIDWGDGTVDHWTASQTTAFYHTYAQAGDYVVRCYGDIAYISGILPNRGTYWDFSAADRVEITTNNFTGKLLQAFENATNIKKVTYSETMSAPTVAVSTGLVGVEYHLYQNISLNTSSAPAMFGTDANVYIHKGSNFYLYNTTRINLVEFCDDFESPSDIVYFYFYGVENVHIKKGKREITDMQFSGQKSNLLKEVIVDDYAFPTNMYNTTFLTLAGNSLETVKIGYSTFNGVNSIIRFGSAVEWGLTNNTTAKIYVHNDLLNAWKTSIYIKDNMRDRFYAMD